MDLRLRSDVQDLIDTVIEFANLRIIDSPGSVEKKFYSLYDHSFHRNQVTRLSIKSLEDCQNLTRAMLTAVVHYGRNKKDDKLIEDSFDVFLWKDLDKSVQIYFERGVLVERVLVRPLTIDAFCRLGAAILLDQGRRYTAKKLYMCDAPHGDDVCGRFRISFSSKAGRPKKYCSNRCRQLGTKQVRKMAQRERRRRIRNT